MEQCPSPSSGTLCEECPENVPIYDAEIKQCRKCSSITEGGDFWDGTQCVQRCPETSDDIVCEACAGMDQSNPVWDPIAQICRPCTTADGGALWDSVARRCVAACPNTAPKVTLWHTCRPCNERQDKGRFWDGEDCVAECPLAWDENMVCKSCMELNEKMPFWSGSECVLRCPSGKQLVSVDDTRCVADCSGMADITVQEHGLMYIKCTTEKSCPGAYYEIEEN